DHGVPDVACDADGVVLGLDLALAAGRGGHFVFVGQVLAGDLVAQQLHRLDAGADELDIAGTADLGEVGVFRKEAVARVDGVDIGNLGGADDARDIEVAFRRGRRADADRLVGQVDMRGVAVGGGIDRD